MGGPTTEDGRGEAVDLVHLGTQTMGDEALAREVLVLFVDQSRKILAGLGDGGRRSAELAHKLVGSARGIGAHEVARTALALESALRSGGDGDAEMPALADAVAKAGAFIASHLARQGQQGTDRWG